MKKNLPIQLTHKLVDLNNLSDEDIRLEDIATSLSRLARYNGHGRYFYSVAEHSVMLANHAQFTLEDLDLARCLLMHDATEAYMGDVIYHLKAEVPAFKEYENALEKTILKRFGLTKEYAARAEQIHEFDRRICVDEMYHLFGMIDPALMKMGMQPIDVCPDWMNMDEAYTAFLEKAAELKLT